MKKKNRNKRFDIKPEIFNYIGMTIVLLLFGFVTYDSGAYYHLISGNFQQIGIDYSSYDLTKFFPTGTKSTQHKNIKMQGTKGRASISKIPVSVISVANSSNTWDNLLKNKQAKVIFYLAENDSRFDNTVKNYVSSNLPYSYIVQSYLPINYMTMNANITVQDDICKSLSECNEMRKRALSYSSVTTFLDRCSRNICIFNNRKNEYIIVRSKNVNDLIEVLNQNKNW